ncbi:MAG TPA: hypothetical protein PLH41_13240, partial [Accumulibacter sp.]|nr:hypothetical protein [Accumulibacter sp.]
MKPLHTRSAVSRADLLRIRAEHGVQALELAAVALGYERRAAPQAVVVSADALVTPVGFGLASVGPPPLPERPAALPTARFFHVTEHRQSEPSPEQSAPDGVPDWVAAGPALSEDRSPLPGSVRLPAAPALTRWSRLWPFLRRALGQSMVSQQPDLQRLVERLTRGEALPRIPRQRRHGWSSRIALLVDYPSRTQTFHADFNQLCGALEKRHGSLGLERRILVGEPGRQPLVRRPLRGATERWQMPAATTPLLILSDLGLLDNAPETQLGWKRFAARLRSAACPALVLCPVPAALHPRSVQRSVEIVEWDRHSLLRRPPADALSAQAATARSAAAVDRLLGLLAPALFVEPPLLRALRHLLPAGEADVLAEAMLWQHPDVIAGAQGVQLAGKAALTRHEKTFAGLAPDVQGAAVALILAHHAGLPESVRRREILACKRLAPQAVAADVWRETEDWLHAFARTALQRPQALALQQCVRRHVDRQSAEVFAADDVQAALWALAQRARVARGEAVELPAGVRPEQVRFFLDPPSERRPIACTLRQRGAELCLEALDAKVGGWPPAGSPYTDLTLVDGGVFVRVRRLPTASAPAAGGASVYLAASALPHRVAVLTREVERVELHAPHLALTVAAIARPRWARALGRDACGLFSEIEVGGVRQRFRWIAPGRFLMGSPADEP